MDSAIHLFNNWGQFIYKIIYYYAAYDKKLREKIPNHLQKVIGTTFALRHLARDMISYQKETFISF